jgi:hypothetical protein
MAVGKIAKKDQKEQAVPFVTMLISKMTMVFVWHAEMAV